MTQPSAGIEAVIFDWAGTTVDFGSLAPIEAFKRLFDNQGIAISSAEARGPMGAEKRQHIIQITQMPRVAEAWLKEFGQAPNEADIDRLYEEFVPLQIDAIRDRAKPVPGLLECIQWLRDQRIKIGGNTGYNRAMLSALSTAIGEQYRPDSSVCADDAPVGRPAPAMSLINAAQLGVSRLSACIKVDDTCVGIAEGRNATMWTIGVAITGNETGLDLSEWQALDTSSQQKYRQQASKRLKAAGAHYVIDSVAELPALVNEINARLAAGELP